MFLLRSPCWFPSTPRSSRSGAYRRENCSSGESRFRVLIGITSNDHHIGFGKHLSCLGGEDHGVMLLFALRADEPWTLNRGIVAVMLHLPRESLQVYVLHLGTLSRIASRNVMDSSCLRSS